MAFANYTLRRVVWPLWAWEARLADGRSAKGYSLGKPQARAAAQAWIRGGRGRPGREAPRRTDLT